MKQLFKPASLIRLLKLDPKQQYGQNFLFDLNITNKFVRSSSVPINGSLVIEIGPGPACITRSLLEDRAEMVVSVEKDVRFRPILDQMMLFYNSADLGATRPRLGVEYANALKINLMESIVDKYFCDRLINPNTGKPRPIILTGNLPFNISTEILTKWINMYSKRENIFALENKFHMLFMFQREVGLRICAESGNAENRGRLGGLVQAYGHPKIVYRVKGSAFVPKCKVSGALVNIDMKDERPACSIDHLEHILRIGFSNRQKMILKNLSHGLGRNDELAEKILQLAGVKGDRRPFTITNAEWEAITLAYMGEMKHSVSSLGLQAKESAGISNENSEEKAESSQEVNE